MIKKLTMILAIAAMSMAVMSSCSRTDNNTIGGSVDALIDTGDHAKVWNMAGAEDIPLNATDYHASWDDMVDKGWVTRELLGYPSDGDERYPVYKYTLKPNRQYLDPKYQVAEGDLYERPRVLIVSGMHGAEKGAPTFLRNVIYDMMTDPELAAVAVKYDWDIIPLINPWGYSHSVLENGVLHHGFLKHQTSFSGYTVVENSDEYNQGIRLNADNLDCNKEWHDGEGGFPSEEARLVRDVLIDGYYDIVLDMHQTRHNTSCGIVSIGLQPDEMSNDEYEEIRKKAYTAIAQAGITTDRAISAYYSIDTIQQTAFPWDGTENANLRNYAAGFTAGGTRENNLPKHARYSFCLETSPYCTVYSGKEPGTGYSEIAHTYGNTFVHNFIIRMEDLM